jgi:hypothetical protein
MSCRAAAVRALESELPDDPRTAVLRLAMSLETGPDDAAAALERFLFERRFRRAP